jgi:hypothetical protein
MTARGRYEDQALRARGAGKRAERANYDFQKRQRRNPRPVNPETVVDPADFEPRTVPKTPAHLLHTPLPGDLF